MIKKDDNLTLQTGLISQILCAPLIFVVSAFFQIGESFDDESLFLLNNSLMILKRGLFAAMLFKNDKAFLLKLLNFER